MAENATQFDHDLTIRGFRRFFSAGLARTSVVDLAVGPGRGERLPKGRKIRTVSLPLIGFVRTCDAAHQDEERG